MDIDYFRKGKWIFENDLGLNFVSFIKVFKGYNYFFNYQNILGLFIVFGLNGNLFKL